MRVKKVLLVGVVLVAAVACVATPPDPQSELWPGPTGGSESAETASPTVMSMATPTAPLPTPTITYQSPLPTPASSATAAASPTATLPPTPTPEALNPLVVNVDATTDVAPFDKGRLLNGAVGGYAPLANLNWLPGAYDALAAIGVEMLRLDHVTDEAFYRVVWRTADGTLQYDFSRLDRVVVTMLQSGIEPVMALSYRPATLEPGGDATVPPTDLSEWGEVVRTFVGHYRDLGYSGLYWEVWNEPDLEFFFKGDAHQYVELYVATSQAVKEADPTARVGGAADSSVDSPGGKLRPLLGHIGAHPEVPLDFVSYHDYSDPDGDGQPPFTLDWDADVIATMVAEVGLEPREIFVTEYNLTPALATGAGAPTDTHVGAAALAVKMFTLLEYPQISRAFHFSPIEGFRPAEVFSGDLGLLTVNYHRKAAYNLFQMIAWLGDRQVAVGVEGENTEGFASYALATRDSTSQSVAVLIWNYWDRGRTVDLSVSGLPIAVEGRRIEVTRYLIDAEHANYFRDYALGLRGYTVGPTEALSPVESSVVELGDALVRRISLAPYSVTLVLLTPSDEAPTAGPVVTPAPEGPRNWAAGAPVAVDSALDGDGWHPQALVDEIAHSLPNAYGWSSAVVGVPEQVAWAELDLGVPREIDTVRLYPRDDQGYEGAGFPVDFAIQGAVDRDAWTDLVVRTAHDHGAPGRQVQVFTFTPGLYRYVRLVATRLGAVGDEGYALQLAEMTAEGVARQ